MIKFVVVNGQKIQLDQNKVLGTGGEATVVRHDKQAIKIYHSPDPARIDKLKDFCKAGLSLPKNVCAPSGLVYDSQGQKVVGFAMPLIPSGREVVQELSRKSFRKSHPGCNSAFITDLFMNTGKTTEALHQSGVVVGDYNDLNFLFDISQPVILFIDVDSYQFGNYPCMVGTENFLHPDLYNLNLADKLYFKVDHDWYAFWCMYIKSLLLCHPYGGVHNQYKSIPQRALAKILAWDKEVKYPKAAYSPDMLNDGLLAIAEKVFRQGQKAKPDFDLLADFKETLVDCKSCGVQYPHTRKACPQCAKVNTQQIQRKVQVVAKPGKMTVSVEQKLSTTGNFIWHRTYGTSVFAISLNGNQYEVYQSTSTGVKHFGSLPAGKDSLIFDLFAGRYLVVGQPTSSQLRIYDLQMHMKLVENSTCDNFQGMPSFACTKDYLVRSANGWMYRAGCMDAVLGYTEDRVQAAMEGQTWFDGSSVNNVVFGFQRYFSNLGFFMYSFDGKPRFYDIEMPALEINESLLDTAFYFTNNSVLVMLKTEIKGKTYTRVVVIRTSSAEVLSQYRLESMPSDTHRSIHGKAFVRPSGSYGFVLHPTDDGVVQEVIDNNHVGKLTLFAETEQFISESDFLINHGSGILVIGDKLVNHLTLS